MGCGGRGPQGGECRKRASSLEVWIPSQPSKEEGSGVSEAEARRPQVHCVFQTQSLSGDNGLWGPPQQEIVTSPPQGPDEGSRAVCDGQPASQELESFTYMSMTGYKNLGSSQQNNIKMEPSSPESKIRKGDAVFP